MDYAGFQARAGRDWRDLAELQARVKGRGLGSLGYEDLERLAALHRRVASDFALVRSQFPGTEVEARLRALVFTSHRLLARPPEPWAPRLGRFLRTGYPAAFTSSWPLVRLAGLFFLGAVLLGYVLTSIHPDFAVLFLGQDAMDGLRRGELWTDALTSAMPPSVTASAIFTNNLTVALVAFAGGALLGLGTLYALFTNGVMLGAVLAVTAHHGLLVPILEFIAAHGPLELFLIVVASGGGLAMGRGAIAWENLPRRMSFREGARAGLALVGGTLPWFVLLGLVEGFISPRADLGMPFKVGLGALLLATFLLYATRWTPGPGPRIPPVHPPHGGKEAVP